MLPQLRRTAPCMAAFGGALMCTLLGSNPSAQEFYHAVEPIAGSLRRRRR